MTSRTHATRAVIIGGSLTGLVTARVLSEHFSQIIVVEQDQLCIEKGFRRGVPQARHAHGLTYQGAQALESLFPGLRHELETAGSPIFDHGEAVSARLPDGPLPLTTSGQLMQVFNRDLLDSTLLKRLIKFPGIRFCDNRIVTGLHMDAEKERIQGVNIHSRLEKTDEFMQADFVVDASGRFSKMPHWLANLGFEVPKDRVVDAQIIYSSGVFTGPERDWQVIYHINNAPLSTRGAYVLRTEDDQWLVTLYGALNDKPPTREHAFRAFAASINNPELNKLLEASVAVSPIVSYARTENRKRCYHQARRWPKRLVVLGDAACAFNPIYGQGISLAVFEAIHLGKLMARYKNPEQLDLIGKIYQKNLARLILWPWWLAISQDLIWEEKINSRRAPWIARSFHWYKMQLYKAVIKDPVLYKLFLAIFHMSNHPLNLFHPRVVVRTLLVILNLR